MTRLLFLCAVLALSAVIVSSELSPLDDRPSDAVVEAQGEGIRRFLQKRSVDTASPVEGEKASNDHATGTAAAGTEDANKPLIRAKRYGYGYGYGYGGYYGGYGGYGGYGYGCGYCGYGGYGYGGYGYGYRRPFFGGFFRRMFWG